MLETIEERIKLLKKGFTQKQMEELYIEGNNFKLVNTPVFFELIEINDLYGRDICMNCIEAVEYAQSICSEVINLCDISNYMKAYTKILP
ncbi:MAG: hypothetical protein FIB07_05685 [Candidatus Methanoperedens sp.]|nr:hypothetical protein [Candidatus Methanoperedens sp.]